MKLIDADELRKVMYHEAFETDSDMQKWDGGCWIRYKMFEKAIDSVQTIEAEPKWIPVSEKLPDVNGDYLLYRPHFWGAYEGQVTVCYWNGHDWSDNYRNDAERYLPVISGMAWMPLPNPYERSEE